MAEALPGLECISLRNRDSYPFCVANIDAIARALESSPDSVCVEGGPCLFGEHEVIGTVTLWDSEKYYFDYSCGKRYVDSAAGSYTDGLDESESDLASFIRTHANEVADVAFTSHKTGLTRQEHLHSVLPFAFAAALDVPLVITLPDMSYRKYLAYASRLRDPRRRCQCRGVTFWNPFLQAPRKSSYNGRQRNGSIPLPKESPKTDREEGLEQRSLQARPSLAAYRRKYRP